MSKHASAQSQRDGILKHLMDVGPLSTLKAREVLGIMSPAPRVLELRAEGYLIITSWRVEHDVTGTPHRIAEYVLFVDGGDAANTPTH